MLFYIPRRVQFLSQVPSIARNHCYCRNENQQKKEIPFSRLHTFFFLFETPTHSQTSSLPCLLLCKMLKLMIFIPSERTEREKIHIRIREILESIQHFFQYLLFSYFIFLASLHVIITLIHERRGKIRKILKLLLHCAYCVYSSCYAIRSLLAGCCYLNELCVNFHFRFSVAARRISEFRWINFVA